MRYVNTETGEITDLIPYGVHPNRVVRRQTIRRKSSRPSKFTQKLISELWFLLMIAVVAGSIMVFSR